MSNRESRTTDANAPPHALLLMTHIVQSEDSEITEDLPFEIEQASAIKNFVDLRVSHLQQGR
jgi:hypothetical protein